MMKKGNEEGFALAYVVVVIFILCSIAIALMSSTLRTLQAQEIMVQRMKDKYEAMGEIERLVAELEAELDSNSFSYSGTCCSASEDAYKDAKDVISEIISFSDFSFVDSDDGFSDLPQFDNSKHTYNGEYYYDVISKFGTVSVHAIISISFQLDIIEHTHKGDALAGIEDYSDYAYEIDISSPIFSLYEITSSTGSEEGGEV